MDIDLISGNAISIANLEFLKNANKEEIMAFIRKKLEFEPFILSQLKSLIDLDGKEHKRFVMSGYDIDFPGTCTVHNQSILNIFAYLGIYDYTKFLFLDFYKGYGTLYLEYWETDISEEIEFDNLGTTEIIYEIFKLTIFSNKTKRRRY